MADSQTTTKSNTNHQSFEFDPTQLPDVSTALDNAAKRARDVTTESAKSQAEGGQQSAYANAETDQNGYRADFNDSNLEISNRFKTMHSSGDNIIVEGCAPAGARIHLAYPRSFAPKGLQLHQNTRAFANNEEDRMTGSGVTPYARFYAIEQAAIDRNNSIGPHGGRGQTALVKNVINESYDLHNKHWLNDVFGLTDWHQPAEDFKKPTRIEYLQQILFEYADPECDSGYGKYQQYAFIPLSLSRNAPAGIGNANFTHTGETSDWYNIGYYGQGYTATKKPRERDAGMHYDGLSWRDFVNNNNKDYKFPWNDSLGFVGPTSDKTLRELLKDLPQGLRRVLRYDDEDNASTTKFYTHGCDDRNFYNSDWADQYYDAFQSPQSISDAGNDMSDWALSHSYFKTDIYPVNMKRSAAGYEAIYGGAGPRKNDETSPHTFAGGKTGTVFRTDKSQKKFNYVIVEYVLTEAMQSNMSHTGNRFDGYGVIYEKCPIVEREGRLYLQVKNAVWWKQLFPWWYTSSGKQGDWFPGTNVLPSDNHLIHWVNIYGGGEMDSCFDCFKASASMFADIKSEMNPPIQTDGESSTSEVSSSSARIQTTTENNDLKNLAYEGHKTEAFTIFSESFESSVSEGSKYTHTFKTSNPSQFYNNKLSLGYYWLNEEDRGDHAYTEYEITSVTEKNGVEVSDSELAKLVPTNNSSKIKLNNQDQIIPELLSGYTKLIIELDNEVNESVTQTTTQTELENQLQTIIDNFTFKISANFDFTINCTLIVNGYDIEYKDLNQGKSLEIIKNLDFIRNPTSIAIEIYSSEHYTRPFTINYSLQQSEVEIEEVDYVYKITNENENLNVLDGIVKLDYSSISDETSFELYIPIIEDENVISQSETISATSTNYFTNFDDPGVIVEYEENQIKLSKTDNSSKEFIIDLAKWKLRGNYDLQNLKFRLKENAELKTISFHSVEQDMNDEEWVDGYYQGLHTTHTFETNFPINPSIPSLNLQQNDHIKMGRNTPLHAFIGTSSNYIDNSFVEDTLTQNSVTQNKIQDGVEYDIDDIVSDEGSVDSDRFFDENGGDGGKEKISGLIAEQFNNLIMMQYSINEGAWLSGTDMLMFYLDTVGGVLDGKMILLKSVFSASKLAKYTGKAAPYITKIGKVSTVLDETLDVGGVGKLTGKVGKLSSHTLGHGAKQLGKNMKWWQRFSQWLIDKGLPENAIKLKYAQTAVNSQGEIISHPGFLEGWWDHLGMHNMPYGRSKIKSLEKIEGYKSPNKFYRELLEETDELNTSKMNKSAGNGGSSENVATTPMGATKTIDNFFEELMDNMGSRIIDDADPRDILKTFDDGNFWHDILDKHDSYAIFRSIEPPPSGSNYTKFSKQKVTKSVALTTKYKGKNILLPMEVIPPQHRETVKIWLRTNPQKVTPKMQKFIDEHMDVWQYMHKLHLIEKYTDLDYQTLMRICAVTDTLCNPTKMTSHGVDWANRATRADIEKSVLRVVDKSAENYKITKTQVWNLSDDDIIKLVSNFEKNFSDSFKYLLKNNDFMKNLNSQFRYYEKVRDDLENLKSSLSAISAQCTGGVENTPVLKQSCRDILSKSADSIGFSEVKNSMLYTIINASDEIAASDFKSWVDTLITNVEQSRTQAVSNMNKARASDDKFTSTNNLDDITIESSVGKTDEVDTDKLFNGKKIKRQFKITTTSRSESSTGQRFNDGVRELETILVGDGETLKPQHIFYVLNDPAAAQSKLGMADSDFLSLYNKVNQVYRDLHHIACSADSALDDLAGYGEVVRLNDLQRILKGDDLFSTTQQVTRTIADTRIITSKPTVSTTVDSVQSVETSLDIKYQTARTQASASETGMDIEKRMFKPDNWNQPIPINNRSVGGDVISPENFRTSGMSNESVILDKSGLPQKFYTLEKWEGGRIVETKETTSTLLLNSRIQEGWRFKLNTTPTTQVVNNTGLAKPNVVSPAGVANFAYHFKKTVDLRRSCINEIQSFSGLSPATLIDDYIGHIESLLSAGGTGQSPFLKRKVIKTTGTGAFGRTQSKSIYTYAEDGVPVIEDVTDIDSHLLHEFADDWLGEQTYQMLTQYRKSIIQEAEGAGGFFGDVKLEKVGSVLGDLSKGGTSGLDDRAIQSLSNITEAGYDHVKVTQGRGDNKLYTFYKAQNVARNLDDAPTSGKGVASARQELAHNVAFVETGTKSRGKIIDGNVNPNVTSWVDDAARQTPVEKMNQRVAKNLQEDMSYIVLKNYLKVTTGISTRNGTGISPKYGTIHNIQQHLNDVIGQPRSVDGVVGGKPKYTQEQLQKLHAELTKIKEDAEKFTPELKGPEGEKQATSFTVTADTGVKVTKAGPVTIADTRPNEPWLSPTFSGQRAPAGVTNHMCSVWEGYEVIRKLEDELTDGLSGASTLFKSSNIAEGVHKGWASSNRLRAVDEIDLGSRLGKVMSNDMTLGAQTIEQIKSLKVLIENLATVATEHPTMQSLNFPTTGKNATPGDQILKLIDKFEEAGFGSSSGFPQNHRTREFLEIGDTITSPVSQEMIDWLGSILGDAGSRLKRSDGMWKFDGIPLPLGSAGPGVEYRKITAIGGDKVLVPNAKPKLIETLNSQTQSRDNILLYDISQWEKYLDTMVVANRAMANSSDSFAKLNMGTKVLDLPTVVVLLKQNPELLQKWFQASGRSLDDIQDIIVYRDPKTNQAVTLDLLIGADLHDAVTINIPVTRGDNIEWMELVLTPPKTVAEAPNGALSGVEKQGWDVVISKGTDEEKFSKSAMSSYLKHGNIANNLLKLNISKIFARSRFIEEFFKNMPTGNLAGKFNNLAISALVFTAHAGFYAKLLKAAKGASTGKKSDATTTALSLTSVTSDWKWNTSIKAAPGLLFAPMSIWMNGYHIIAKELKNISSSGSFPERWNEAFESANEKGIPQDQMCSMYHTAESWDFPEGYGFNVTWQLGMVGHALGMPLQEYIQHRINMGQPDDSPQSSSDFQEQEHYRIGTWLSQLENDSEVSIDLPVSYAIATGEMGVPLHGVIAGNNELNDELSTSQSGLCWSKKAHGARKWGYYEKDDSEQDIELLSQDVCYACWPAYFPKGFCKGPKTTTGQGVSGYIGGSDNLEDFPCMYDLEADTLLTDTKERYPGFEKNFDNPDLTTDQLDDNLYKPENPDFTPNF